MQWVQNDLCEVTVRLRNPLPFELHIDDMRLLTNGVVFESLPETIVLAPGQPTVVTLHGTPIEHGSLEIQGYSTHALGVKSNCRLKSMQPSAATAAPAFPPVYVIDVIPALPTLRLGTSLPQTATFGAAAAGGSGGGGAAGADTVTVTAALTLCNGESAECVVTLYNNSTVPITFVEESLHSGLEARLQQRIFGWSADDLQVRKTECSTITTKPIRLPGRLLAGLPI